MTEVFHLQTLMHNSFIH